MKKLLAVSALALVLSAPLALQAAQDGPPPPVKKRMEAVLEKLPPEKAEAFKATLKASREANKDKREGVKKLHDELAAIVTAPTFDKAAFLAKHKEIDAARAEMSDTRHAAMAEALSKLSQDERKTVSEGMKKAFKRPPHEGPGEGPGEKPE